MVLIGAMLSVSVHIVDALVAGDGPRQSPGGFAFWIFLGYLAVVTFIILRHGVSVLENKDLARMNTSMNRFLASMAIVASFALIAYTLYFNPPIKVILFALSPIGVSFAVFGLGRLFNLGLTGLVAVVPWILPTLIGVPAFVIWTRHYQRKFDDVPA